MNGKNSPRVKLSAKQEQENEGVPAAVYHPQVYQRCSKIISGSVVMFGPSVSGSAAKQHTVSAHTRASVTSTHEHLAVEGVDDDNNRASGAP